MRGNRLLCGIALNRLFMLGHQNGHEVPILMRD
jgi:hypothetical protein